MSKRRPQVEKKDGLTQEEQEDARRKAFEAEWAELPQPPLEAGIAFRWGGIKLRINGMWDRLYTSLYETIYSREALAAKKFKAPATASPEYLGKLVDLEDKSREFKTTDKYKDAIICLTMFSGLETMCANRLYELLHGKSLDDIIALVLSDTAGRTGDERKEITVLVLFIYCCYLVRTTEPSDLFEQVLDHIPDAHPGQMEYTAVLDANVLTKSNALLNWAIVDAVRGDTFPKENTALAAIVGKLFFETDAVKYMEDIVYVAKPHMSVAELTVFVMSNFGLTKYGQSPESVANAVPAGTQVIALSAIDIQNGIVVAGQSIIQKPELLAKAIREMQSDVAASDKRVAEYIKKSDNAQWSRLGKDAAGRLSVLYSNEILPNYQNLEEGDSQGSVESTASMTEAQMDDPNKTAVFDPVDLSKTTFGQNTFKEDSSYVISRRGEGLGVSTQTKGEKKLLRERKAAADALAEEYKRQQASSSSASANKPFASTSFASSSAGYPFSIGQRVQATINSSNDTRSNAQKITIRGSVASVGKIQQKEGDWVGIYLDEQYRELYATQKFRDDSQRNDGIYVKIGLVKPEGDLIQFDVGGRRRRKTRKIKRSRKTKKVKKVKKSKKSRRSKK
jgi:hypothetical protein